MSNEREKDALVSKARHNLKNPVNAILGFSEMLIEDCEDEGYDSIIPDLEKIHNAGKDILKIIEDSFSELSLILSDLLLPIPQLEASRDNENIKTRDFFNGFFMD